MKHKTNAMLDAVMERIPEHVFWSVANDNPTGSRFTDEQVALLDEHLLPGVKAFFDSLPGNDLVILTTARLPRHEMLTKAMLRHFEINYDQIIFGLPSGVRVLINDSQPMPDGSEVVKAYAIPVTRNAGF